MYGYNKLVETNISNRRFGLNEKVRLVKFEWINNAGKGGSEGEALDIAFLINGDEKPISYRQFPITKVRDWKTGEDITDREHPTFKKTVEQFVNRISSIMLCFVSSEEMDAKLSTKIPSFKEYCKILVSLLPKNFDQIELDLFLQYQSNIKGEAKVTYLEVPASIGWGRFVCRHVEPVGLWSEVRDSVGLHYVDGDKNMHPFKRADKWLHTDVAMQKRVEEAAETVFETPMSTEADSAGW